MEQVIRKGLRIFGRILICLLLGLLCTSRLMHPDMVRHTYLSAYQNFRQMGIVKRMFMLPYARDILVFFEVLWWADVIYEALAGICILLGNRIGGWMMFGWFLIKIFICYSPYLLNAPRLPFTYRQRYQVVRNFAILGVSLALTHLYRPITDKKSERPKVE